MRPKALILRTAGTNCDRETAWAFELAGAETVFLHINSLLESSHRLHDYQLLAIPGGFSYGDDINSGRIFANQIVHHLAEGLHQFVDAGKPIIGICNGFQVLVKTGILPGPLAGYSAQTATLAHNVSHRFIDRWITLAPRSHKCIWTQNLPETFDLPIAHGEGRFVPADESARKALHDEDQIALVYAVSPLTQTREPYNPNGSTDDIAGVCDPSGLVFGLMPHPERHITAHQHPAWTTRQPVSNEGAGLAFFRNAVNHIRTAYGTMI